MKIIKRQFTGYENHSITAIEGIGYIKNYQASNPESASGCYVDGKTIKTLTEQPGAVGLRYYYALTKGGRKVVVLVGTDANGQDLLNGEPVKCAMFIPPFTTGGSYDRAQINHDIAIEDAARLTANYRRENPDQVKGGFFGEEAFKTILAQQNCVGIRFLYGARENGMPAIVLVGVDQFGADMFFGRLFERSSICPPFCDDNILNPLGAKLGHASNAEPEIRYLKAA